MFNDNENNPFDLANDEINTDRNNLLKTNENNNNEDKERIKKLSIELAKELVDKKTLQTYGTSFNE